MGDFHRDFIFESVQRYGKLRASCNLHRNFLSLFCIFAQKIRPLTTIERSYIQTFPSHFKWVWQNKSDLEQIIGNAVPVKLAEYVANALNRYITDKNLIF
jgi:site-specific DNA-cytosine methylase